MHKTHLYFVPGLAASSKIFEYLTLPKERFECHFLEWKMPFSVDESIVAYSLRMCEEIKHENPVLVGVSFGGIVAQEMSKHIVCKQIILISSLKNKSELPTFLKIAQITKIYKLFPAKFVANIELYTAYFLGNYLQKRAKLYKKYLSVRNPMYLHWGIYNVLHWKQKETLTNVEHLHGTADVVFPIKYISNCIKIPNGSHEMVLMNSKIISSELVKILTR